MNAVSIAGRPVGAGHPCFIIAEAGSNHNGSLDQAKRLIDVAAQAGADAVKFQLFRAEKLYPRKAGRSDYLRTERSIYDIVADMEMPYEWLQELSDHCKERGLIFLASVFDEESVDRLDPYVPAYKVASYEMTHLPLVRYIARKGKPVIIATGTATLEEVRETVGAFTETGNRSLLLMQCTAAYPAPMEALNVRAIVTLRDAFQVPVGLSDHSRDPLVGPVAATALGANLLEKHFTLSNRLPGPDQPFAVEPEELTQMIQAVRRTEKALGDGRKVVQEPERELRSFARRQIFAAKDIQPGEPLTAGNLAVLRRGKLPEGLEPRHYQEILGRRALRSILQGSAIQREDVD